MSPLSLEARVTKFKPPVKVGLSECVGCPSTHSYGLDHERDYARVVWFHHELHFDWHFQEITIKKERKEEK